MPIKISEDTEDKAIAVFNKFGCEIDSTELNAILLLKYENDKIELERKMVHAILDFIGGYVCSDTFPFDALQQQVGNKNSGTYYDSSRNIKIWSWYGSYSIIQISEIGSVFKSDYSYITTLSIVSFEESKSSLFCQDINGEYPRLANFFYSYWLIEDVIIQSSLIIRFTKEGMHLRLC